MCLLKFSCIAFLSDLETEQMHMKSADFFTSDLCALFSFYVIRRDRCPVVIDKSITHHEDSIRAIKFNRQGKLFASAGDDKLVKLWDTESWQCIKIL